MVRRIPLSLRTRPASGEIWLAAILAGESVLLLLAAVCM